MKKPELKSLVDLGMLAAAIVVWLTTSPPPGAVAQTPPGPATPTPVPPNRTAPLSPTQEKALKPKDTFKECANCPEMTVAPAGSFTMGSPDSEPEHATDEGPQHMVSIARPFAVGRFEVTFDERDACAGEGGCNGYRPPDEGRGWDRRPVVNVSWDDAKAYVAWLSKKTGKPYRLLSGSEYEYATRAGTQTAYPWGDAIGTNNASCHSCGSQWDARQTAPVGSFAPNGFGLYDMVGNVREWTEDCYHDTYNDAPTDGSAWTAGTNCYLVSCVAGPISSHLPSSVQPAAIGSRVTTGSDTSVSGLLGRFYDWLSGSATQLSASRLNDAASRC